MAKRTRGIHLAVCYWSWLHFRSLDSDRHRSGWRVILNVVGDIIGTLFAIPGSGPFLIILPSVLLVISVIGAYRRGRVLGLISVIVAYISGLVILVSLMTSVILLIIAVISGYLATNRRMRKKLTGI